MSTQPFSSRRPGISVTRRIASGPSAVKANGSPKRRNDGKTRQGNRGEVARAADAWAVQRSAAQGDRAALQRTRTSTPRTTARPQQTRPPRRVSHGIRWSNAGTAAGSLTKEGWADAADEGVRAFAAAAALLGGTRV